MNASLDKRAAAVAGLSGVAIWLLTRRYDGIHNDAALYALMALAWRDPARFASDLFVRFGSQDPFSIFSPIYSSAIGAFSFQGASIVLTLAAHALWLYGAWRLTHALARGIAGHLAFVTLAAISAVYGGWAVLYAGEGLLTPRPFAEGLSLLALAWLMRGAWLRCVAALVLALLLHPAMALAGIGAAWMLAALRRPVLWWAAGIGAALTVLLAAAGVEPFGRLARIMDPAWLTAVKAHNGFVFTGAWLPADWVRLAAQLALCIAAAVWSKGERRRLFIAAAFCGAGGTLAALIGADGLHDELIVQLQTWRLAWLTAVVSLPAIIVLALRLRRKALGPAAVALLAAPVIILTRPFCDKPWAWALALVMSAAGLAFAVSLRAGRAPNLSRTARRMIIEAAIILPLGAGADSLINLAQDWVFFAQHHAFSLDPTSFVGVRLILLAAGAGLILLTRRAFAAALATASVALIIVALAWDGRTAWERYIVSGAAPPTVMPAAGAVLWSEDAPPTWFLLRRPAYVSMTQGAGLLFSHATADAWRARAAIARPLVNIQDWSLASHSPSCAQRLAPVSLDTVRHVCVAAGPDLAGVVLDRPLVGGRARTFTTPAPEPIYCQAKRDLKLVGIDHFAFVACPAER
ncbi:MAG TPA: hypothetical protein VGN38_09725 [Caulobacteraceae bacterium]|nr:hypothetical protein [Caulobacteraceae bacterium]